VSAEREKKMRYLTIKLPKTPKDFYSFSSSSASTRKKEEEKEEEAAFEEIPPEDFERARIGLYDPEREREPMTFLSRAAKEKCTEIESQGFAKELEKEERKIDEKAMLLGKRALKTKAIESNEEMFPGEDVPVEKTTRALEKRREKVFRDFELPCLPPRTQNTARHILEAETIWFERDLRRDENGENEEDDDDDNDRKKIKRQTHFFSRAEREQLYDLPNETLAKLDCVENLLRTIYVHPPAQREFDCFAGGAGIREKTNKRKCFLELPVLVGEPKRTFLERVWPIGNEKREAMKVSGDLPEETKFSLLSEEETLRVPLFKPSKIEDIDAYVEARRIVAKPSTLPSFMLPVEENYPIRYNTATVVGDVNANPAPGSDSLERTLLPSTEFYADGYDLHSPPRAIQKQQQKQMISPRFLALNFPEGKEMVQDSVDFYKSNMKEKKTKKATTTTTTTAMEVLPNSSGGKNVGSASRPKTPGSGTKQHLQTKLNFAYPQAAAQKRENEKQPEIEFFAFRVPEHPHGFAIEEIAREYDAIRERMPISFGSAVPTFDARIDYDLYVSRMREAEERERKAGHIDTATNWRRLKDLLTVAYLLESYGVTVANLQLRYENNQTQTSSGTNHNTIFVRMKSKAEDALEAAVSSVQRGESLDNPKLGALRPLVQKCRADSSGLTKMLIVVPEQKAIGPIVKHVHAVGGRVNCLPSKKYLQDGHSEQEESLFVEDVRKIVSKNNLDALIILEQHFVRVSFPVSDFAIVVFYAPSRDAENIVQSAINAKRFRGIERNGAIKIFTTDVEPLAHIRKKDRVLRSNGEFKLQQPDFDWEEDEKNAGEYMDDDILGFDDILPIDEPAADDLECATPLPSVNQTRLVVCRDKHSLSMIDRIEVKVQQSKLARVIRRRLFDRIDDPNVKEIYSRVISLITTKEGVKAICLFRMCDTREIQSGDLQEVFFMASRCANVLSRSFYWMEFIFEIEPEYLEAREAESFVAELRRQLSKDKVDIDVTFSSERNIVDTIFKAIIFEADATAPSDEDKTQSNDDSFPYIAEKDFALLPGESSGVWEIALSDLFPYVNAITILVLIEHGLEVDKVVKDRKLTREDYETCQRLCGCPMKAFNNLEEDEEERDRTTQGAYENDLFEAEKKMRSPLQSPMHSKSPQQQFSNRDMHFVPPSRPHSHPPRFDKALGIGTFMGSPSSPSHERANARGGGNTEEYYHNDPNDADVPKNTTLSKHQQGREAVLRMMSKQKKTGGSSNSSSHHHRSIASPTKIVSAAPPRGEFFAFQEHFRPEAYLRDADRRGGYGRNKNKKKELRTRTTATIGGGGGFPSALHRNEYEDAKDIDDEFPISPYYSDINKRRGGGGGWGGQNRKFFD